MNSRQLQDLTDDPPSKSPYFTLPDVSFLNFKANISSKFKYKRKTAPNTVTKIWGPAKKMTEDNKINFLSKLLQFATIDFDAMTKGIGIASGLQLKKRLNTIIGEEGYKLEGGQVVPAAVEGENQITKTTEITITEIDRKDTPDTLSNTPEADATSFKASKVVKDAATKVTKKRKTVDRGAPKEVLKKKQKKVVERVMREESVGV